MPKEFPTVITPEILRAQSHVDDAQIAKDIADTEEEITRYTRLQAAEEETARVHPAESERRIAQFKAEARPGMIEDRRKFVTFLKALQEARRMDFPRPMGAVRPGAEATGHGR